MIHWEKREHTASETVRIYLIDNLTIDSIKEGLLTIIQKELRNLEVL